MTITRDVPQDLETPLSRVSLEDVARFALAAIRHEFSGNEAEVFSTLSEEDYAAIKRGLDDADAGRVYDSEEAFALLRREWRIKL